MKTVCVATFLFFLLPHSLVAAQDVEISPSVKYWIFLQDKMEAPGKQTRVEADYVSQRTIERRAARAHADAYSDIDAPLSRTYLTALADSGVEPVIVSRWFNAVSAWLSEDELARVRSLPFVVKVQPVGRSVPAVINEDVDAGQPVVYRDQTLFQESTIFQPPALRPLNPDARLNYGASRAQLEIVNAIAPIERGIIGTGVRIGILDTNFDGFQHTVFSQLRADGRVLADSNFTGFPTQTNMHARSVASVAVGFLDGQLIGPAYGAMVVGATTEYAPTETNQEEDNYVAALEWMESQMGVDVVNGSLGYTTFDIGQENYTVADLDGDTAITTRAADMAAALGVVMVVSAGNEGGAFDPWKRIVTPADGDFVIAVGSVDLNGVRSSFSSPGPTADGRIKPDVSALGRGVRLVTSSGILGNSNGTSFSSPMVAAVAAQMLQANPDLSPIDVRDILRETASLGKEEPSQQNNQIGWGVIDADAAIRRAEELVVSVEEGPGLMAVSVSVPYPNPTRENAVFEIRAIESVSRLRLSIYNLLGQRIAVPFDGTLTVGLNRVVMNTDSFPSGVYLYRLEDESGRIGLRSKDNSASGKIVVVH